MIPAASMILLAFSIGDPCAIAAIWPSVIPMSLAYVSVAVTMVPLRITVSNRIGAGLRRRIQAGRCSYSIAQHPRHRAPSQIICCVTRSHLLQFSQRRRSEDSANVRYRH